MIDVVRTKHDGHQLFITGDTAKDKEKAMALIQAFIEKV